MFHTHACAHAVPRHQTMKTHRTECRSPLAPIPCPSLRSASSPCACPCPSLRRETTAPNPGTYPTPWRARVNGPQRAPLHRAASTRATTGCSLTAVSTPLPSLLSSPTCESEAVMYSYGLWLLWLVPAMLSFSSPSSSLNDASSVLKALFVT